MNKHSASYVKKNPFRQVDKKQKIIVVGKGCEGDTNVVSMKLVNFNQETALIELAKTIIVDEPPFKFFEYEGFRKFMEVAQPYFKIPSHVTIARYYIQVFNDEKEKLKCILPANKQMVSLTNNTWTSIQNVNYMCVTAHYIDKAFRLHKKILKFCLICNHKS